jgi:hypothetical protein
VSEGFFLRECLHSGALAHGGCCQVEIRRQSFFIVIIVTLVDLITLIVRINTFLVTTTTFSNVRCVEIAAAIICCPLQCVLLSNFFSSVCDMIYQYMQAGP